MLGCERAYVYLTTGRFFECHEVLEEFYQETEDANKPFLEGLIQLAAAFRLFADFGEVKGPVRMIYQALIRFENYQPAHLEFRVKDLSESMEAWAKEAERRGGKPSTAYSQDSASNVSVFFHDRS